MGLSNYPILNNEGPLSHSHFAILLAVCPACGADSEPFAIAGSCRPVKPPPVDRHEQLLRSLSLALDTGWPDAAQPQATRKPRGGKSRGAIEGAAAPSSSSSTNRLAAGTGSSEEGQQRRPTAPTMDPAYLMDLRGLVVGALQALRRLLECGAIVEGERDG